MRRTDSNEYTTIPIIKLVRETQQAYLIRTESQVIKDQEIDTWIPKSQVAELQLDADDQYIVIKTWLATKTGLV